MSDINLLTLSDQMADAIAAVAASVVQVHGRRRPASGIVYSSDVVLTTTRALGREDGLGVRTPDGRTIAAELAGWDPATSLAVLRAPDLGAAVAAVADRPVRVGHLAFAVGRSWSNAVTASAGIVSVIGGPLPTGRGRSIHEVIRTTAPMHDGFAGGAFADVSGRVVGIATAAEIRGLGVVIPASIAWKTAEAMLERGRLRRGYLGLAGQPVQLGARQIDGLKPDTADAGGDRSGRALLVVAITPKSPAEASGVLVGDVILEFDGHPVEAPEDLLELLIGDRVGRSVPVSVLRGEAAHTIMVTVGERPAAA